MSEVDRRCLFVESDRLANLMLDGPALRLRVHHRSRQWFPLRRLSRVICVGVPDAAFQVWAEVAQQGVPVIFVQKSGKVLAQLTCPTAGATSFDHWIAATLADVELGHYYQFWRENLLRHSYGLIGVMGCDEAHVLSRAESQLARLLRNSLAKDTGQTRDLRAWTRTLVESQITQQLNELGLLAGGECANKLKQDLLEPGFHLAMLMVLQGVTNRRLLSAGQLARLYEQRAEMDIQAWLQRELHSLREGLEKTGLCYADWQSCSA